MVAFVSPDWPRYSSIAPVGSQAAQPHLGYGSTYHPPRPTKLDKIKNLYSQFQGGRFRRGCGVAFDNCSVSKPEPHAYGDADGGAEPLSTTPQNGEIA